MEKTLANKIVIWSHNPLPFLPSNQPPHTHHVPLLSFKFMAFFLNCCSILHENTYTNTYNYNQLSLYNVSCLFMSQGWLFVGKQSNYNGQSTYSILNRSRKANPKIHMESQKTKDSQSSPEQKGQYWRYHDSRFPDILQNHSNRNGMVPTRKQNRHWSVEQTRRRKHECTTDAQYYIWY